MLGFDCFNPQNGPRLVPTIERERLIRWALMRPLIIMDSILFLVGWPAGYSKLFWFCLIHSLIVWFVPSSYNLNWFDFVFFCPAKSNIQSKIFSSFLTGQTHTKYRWNNYPVYFWMLKHAHLPHWHRLGHFSRIINSHLTDWPTNQPILT